MFFDPTMLLLIPAFLFAMYAQRKIRSTYNKYQQVAGSRGITGYETAKEMMRLNGIHDVTIEEVQGTLSDHYDPRAKAVRLSSANYHGTSLAAVSVAAHEVGHVIQHATGYAPLGWRSAIVPLAHYGSSIGVRGTPNFFIGRLEGNELVDAQHLSGAQPFSAFERILGTLLD